MNIIEMVDKVDNALYGLYDKIEYISSIVEYIKSRKSDWIYIGDSGSIKVCE
jgi:hypothetical protein